MIVKNNILSGPCRVFIDGSEIGATSTDGVSMVTAYEWIPRNVNAVLGPLGFTKRVLSQKLTAVMMELNWERYGLAMETVTPVVVGGETIYMIGDGEDTIYHEIDIYGPDVAPMAWRHRHYYRAVITGPINEKNKRQALQSIPIDITICAAPDIDAIYPYGWIYSEADITAPDRTPYIIDGTFVSSHPSLLVETAGRLIAAPSVDRGAATIITSDLAEHSFPDMEGAINSDYGYIRLGTGAANAEDMKLRLGPPGGNPQWLLPPGQSRIVYNQDWNYFVNYQSQHIGDTVSVEIY